MKDGVLYRRIVLDEEPLYQLVLPASHRDAAFTGLHDDVGHLGFERTLDFMRRRFYYPRMTDDIQQRVRVCERCIRRKALPQHASKMQHLQSRGPMDLVCIDFLSLEPDSHGYENVLIVTDHYTRLAQAFVTRNQKAQTVAKILWENYFMHYGFPRLLHSDQAKDFTANVIKQLCKITNVKKTRCTPYHPQGNSQCERFNKTLMNMLGSLPQDKKSNWKKYVPSMVHAYNCSKNDATGASPFFLMFGRQARLPVDIAMGVSPDQHSFDEHKAYVKDLRERLDYAYQRATEEVQKSNTRSKARFDAKVTEVTLNKGDRVLVRNVGLRGKCKLADKWATDVYIVKEQPDIDLPVYVVYPESNPRRLRTLHRDMLLPCGFLPISPSYHKQDRRLRQKPKSKSSSRSCDKHLYSSNSSLESFKPSYQEEHEEMDEVAESSSTDIYSDSSDEEVPRRSGRVRREPDRLGYAGLGQPAIQGNTNMMTDWIIY